MECTNCGRNDPRDGRYCPECGSDVRGHGWGVSGATLAIILGIGIMCWAVGGPYAVLFPVGLAVFIAGVGHKGKWWDG